MLAGLGLLALALCLTPATGSAAATYGELTRFGQGAPAEHMQPGQINDEEQRGGEGVRLTSHLIGVDPTDNSVYVLDEPKRYEQGINQKASEFGEEECYAEAMAEMELPELRALKKRLEKVKGHVGLPELLEEWEVSEEGEILNAEERGELRNCLEAAGREGPISRHFRIQKFTADSHGDYHVVASAQFEEKSPEGFGVTGGRLQVEGIAVDPLRKVVYVLAIDEREIALAVDENSLHGSRTALPVASTLFAFSTEEKQKRKEEDCAEQGSECELVPASHDKGGTAVLTGPGECKEAEKGGLKTRTGCTELAARSTDTGSALLEPTGLTVDPENGDIIVVAHEDPGGSYEEPAETEIHNPLVGPDLLYDREEGHGGKKYISADHFVLQRISPTGEVVPKGSAGRWVDEANFFKNSVAHEAPNSPVVVGPEGAEKLYVQYAGGIVALPVDFASTAQPEIVNNHVEGEGDAEGRILSASDENTSSPGGALTASPYEHEGNTVYASSRIENEQPGVAELSTGVIALSATGSLIGWAGAQNINTPRAETEPHYSCVINPAVGEEHPAPVAAGSEGKVFVLATEFLEKEMREHWDGEEESWYPRGPYPGVIELGPKGGGCPQAVPGGLSAEVPGQKEAVNTVDPGEPVTLASYINQADALTVEWNFGDGTSETVSYAAAGCGTGGSQPCGKFFHCPASSLSQFEPKYKERYSKNTRQCPSVEHAFTRSGPVTVKETVYTDDLANPIVEQEIPLTVAGGSLGPTAVLTGPVKVTLGQEATFDGKASFDTAGPNQIVKYNWDFGDGHQETTELPTVQHLYASVGLYEVSLSVTDTQGNESKRAMLPSPVAVEEPSTGSEAAGPPPSQSASSGPPLGPPPSGGPRGHTGSHKAVTDVRLVSASLTAGAEGKVALMLSCPADEKTCAGQLALRALVAGSARGAKKPKAAMTTLASGSFKLAGGHPKRVVLRLTVQARVLLARLHKLSAQLTILAHDPGGARHTTRVAVVLHEASRKRAKR